MRIVDVIVTQGVTGFYFDDQKAIKLGAIQDGFAYQGPPRTSGFSAVRQRGESSSIMLLLEDGQVAFGDCAAVQYSGAGGRDPLYLAGDFNPIIMTEIAPKLIGRELTSFRTMADEFDGLLNPSGSKYHTAIRYGVTQAILDGVAKAKKRTMAQVIAEEYQTKISQSAIPIFCQTGDDRFLNADKAIIKRAQVLPHALINNVAEKLGHDGSLLLEYVTWLRNRVIELGGPHYKPTFHIDVYGTLGMAFNEDTTKIASYLGKLEQAASPFSLRIEGPMDAGGKVAQINTLKKLKDSLKEMGINVEIVADEWCNTLEDIKEFVDAEAAHMVQIKTPDLGGINNTIEAVLYCKQKSIGAYLGGTCNETNRSAEICVHIALATQPVQMLAKPGMGVDEGYMIVYNEMQRTLALHRRGEASQEVL